MKKYLLLLIVFAIIYIAANAQTKIPPTFIKSFSSEKTNCIPTDQEKILKKKARQNIQQLIKEGKIHANDINKPDAAFKLYWPLKPTGDFTDSAYFAESNFVDQDASASLLDWNCGARTYDGHTGTDISLWPFPWLMTDSKMIKVVAAADGIIADKHDGEYDRNCYAGGQAANYVTIEHSNSYQTIYYHMKKGTVTTKSIGASVTKGETLGYVASSGSSTGPHLHFGVYDAADNVIDPYKGSCNPTSTGLWKKQETYWGRSVHKTMVTTTPSVYPYCPNPEQINEFSSIPLGWTGHFFSFMSEIKSGDTIFLKITRPNASVWKDYYYVVSGDYVFAYFYWAWNIGLAEPKGTWKWLVTFNKKTTTYNFTVTDASLLKQKPDNTFAINAN